MAEHRRPGRIEVGGSARTAVLWETLVAALPEPADVVDLGGGTGGLAVPLAVQGHRVTVVDPSPDALAALQRRAAQSGVGDRVRAMQGDAADLPALVPASSTDLVCLHGVLEHVDDPAQAVASAVAVLRPRGVVSVLAAQRLAAVLGRALAGRFTEAAHALADPAGRWGTADPLPRRFDRADLVDLLSQQGLRAVQSHGVRVFADLVPPAAVDGDTEAGSSLLELERLASTHAELVGVAAQLHLLARLG